MTATHELDWRLTVEFQSAEHAHGIFSGSSRRLTRRLAVTLEPGASCASYSGISSWRRRFTTI